MAENDTQYAVESIGATPSQSEDAWEGFPWTKFRGYTKSQRAGQTSCWIWQHGFDIELGANTNKRRWVCRIRVKQKKHPPHSTVAGGTQNAENHLFFEHNLWVPSGKRKPPAKVKEKAPSKNISQFFQLNTHDEREQAIANAIISNFDRVVFQRLVVAWIIESQGSFRQAEHPRLRAIFNYLNPLVMSTEANICHDTVRRRILEVYNANKTHMRSVLEQVRGKIHLAFDGWRSRNRHAMYGIVCFFLNKLDRPEKLVLGIPEIVQRHRRQYRHSCRRYPRKLRAFSEDWILHPRQCF